jgi:hypothetical protein
VLYDSDSCTYLRPSGDQLSPYGVNRPLGSERKLERGLEQAEKLSNQSHRTVTFERDKMVIKPQRSARWVSFRRIIKY